MVKNRVKLIRGVLHLVNIFNIKFVAMGCNISRNTAVTQSKTLLLEIKLNRSILCQLKDQMTVFFIFIIE